ncbi:MAG: DUF951 domain-containing protein [Christensenellales bacterium]
MSEEIRLQDVVEMRKPHPCGSREWTVIRIGADIKIRCSGCGRIVMLDRADFLRRRRKTLKTGPVPAEVSLGLCPPDAPGDDSERRKTQA